MSRSNDTLQSLEGFIDTVYNKLANQNKAMSSDSHQAAGGPSPPVVHGSSTANQPMDSSVDDKQPMSSTLDLDTSSQQTNNGQNFDPATPAALNEGITQGFFSDLLGRFTGASKKRKLISPITGEDGRDITLDENSTKIGEAVYQSVIASMSEMMDEYKSALSFQFMQLESDMRAKIEDELMTDAEDNEVEGEESEVDALREEVNKLKDQLAITVGRLTRSEKQIQELNEELLQMQARMMRDNLVFYNVKEHPNESPADCSETLRGFLKDEMKIDDGNLAKVKFDRVHRMGQKDTNRTRPIVAKFNPFEGKGIVLRHIKNLDRNKKFGVNDQLPRELEERKKQLLPQYKEARREDKKPKWAVDKLVVGKKVTQVKKDCVMDINVDTTEAASQVMVNHAPPKTYRGSTFRGHNVPIQTQDDIIPALHAVYSDERVARATHNIYAYRLQTGNGIVEHYEDDREWGAGRLLLKLLKDNDITGKLVCVTRWYGGVHLGRARFDHIQEAARDTLQLGAGGH